MSNFGDDDFDLEKLFKEIDLKQQEPGFSNHDNASFPVSQVPLFSTIRSPTEMSDDEVPSVTLTERVYCGLGRVEPGS